jgi:hypothetical protein
MHAIKITNIVIKAKIIILEVEKIFLKTIKIVNLFKILINNKNIKKVKIKIFNKKNKIKFRNFKNNNYLICKNPKHNSISTTLIIVTAMKIILLQH